MIDETDEPRASAEAQDNHAISAEDILDIDDIETKDVFIPKWGQTITIRSMTMAEAEAIISAAQVRDGEGGKKPDQKRANKLSFQACVVRPSFTMEQVERLWQKHYAAVATVVKEINILNGFAEESQKDAENSFRD